MVGYFRVSWGFVGISCGFVISSSWELGDSYSRGILGCSRGWDTLGSKISKENVHLIYVREYRGCFSFMVYIRIL